MTKHYFWIVCFTAFATATAEEGIVVDHSMSRGGGGFSDTAVVVSAGQLWWEQIADDFQLEASATVRRVTWWGYYWLDAVPSEETMRIRIYDARPSDGLPANLIRESSVLNPSRAATGEIIPHVPPGTIGTALEYVFEATLPVPVSLDANTSYWLEIVQVGDADTSFFWNGALADRTGTAYLNADTSDWQRTPAIMTRDSAFRLSTVPEPATLNLLALGIALLQRRRRTLAS